MPRLELALLGPFQVAVDGDPVESFPYEKVRALLAYLVAESGRAHSRSALAGLLWPDKPETAARQNLSQALSTLRRVLGESGSTQTLFVATHQDIQFARSSDHEIDAVRFQSLLSACEEHGPAGIAPCPRCLENVLAAVSLYRGDFLEDIAVPDAPEFHEWMLVQQANYQRQVTAALGMAARAYEETGDYAHALTFAQRQLELVPWQEESHRHVMRLLALDGRRLDALRQFEVCRRTMRVEMDVEPETETLSLYEKIRSGEAVVAATNYPPHNLQAQLTPLIGREVELAALAKRLRSPEGRLVVLVGPGGSGKSRLAVEVAQRLLPSFADGVYRVSLSSLTSSRHLAQAIAQAIGLNLYDAASPDEQVQQYLRTKRVLLVLDNFEHLLDGAPLVSELLHASQNLKVLVTSRARLNLRAEHVMRLRGLETPGDRPEPPTAVQEEKTEADFSAVQLFLYQARRAVPDFSPAGSEMDSVVRICRLVDGMPLGILLAASWVDVLDAEQIARRVAGEESGEQGEAIDFLRMDWQDVAPRQRSMRAVLDQSWRLLDETGERVLTRLSIFRGEFSADAAQQVAGASLRQLRALVDRSLLESTQSGRFALHEHLRQYAVERLAEMAPESWDTVGARHAAYYLHRLQEAGEALHDHRQIQAVAEIASDFENIRAAWRQSIEHGEVDGIAGGLDGLSCFLVWKFRLTEGKALCALASDRLRAEGASRRPVLLAETLACEAKFTRLSGDLVPARALIAEAHELVNAAEKRGEDVRRTRALVLQQFGHIVSGSTPSDAEAMWRESLALFRRLDERWRVAELLIDLSQPAALRSEWDEVDRLCEEAIRIQRALGDERGTIPALSALCSSADCRARIAEAVEYMEESRRISRKLGDRHGEAASEFHLAIEHMYLGEFEKAYALLESAAKVSDDLGALSLRAWVLHFLAWDCTNLGWYEQAREFEKESRVFFQQLGEADGIAYSDLVSGEIRLAEGEHGAALALLEECLERFQHLDDRIGQGLAFNSLACYHALAGNLNRARDCVGAALRIVADTRDYGPALGAVSAASLFKAKYGCVEEAVTLDALFAKHPYISESLYRHHVVGRHVMCAAEALPPDRLANAQQSGKELDLLATIDELDAEFNRSTDRRPNGS